MSSRKQADLQSEWPANHKPWGLSWQLIPLPTEGTPSGQAFFMNWARTNHLSAFIVQMAGHITRSNELIREALKEVEREASSSPGGNTSESAPSPLDILRRQRQLFFELILCRHVDNYLTYLASLLQEVFTKRPETLKSKEQIDIQLVLEQDSLEGIIRVIAERKVQQLAYASFADLSEYFRKRLGLVLIHPVDEPRIIQAIEIRNISVHNGCIINRRYIERVGGDASLFGSRREITLGDVEPLAIMLGRAAARLERHAVGKFGLPGVQFEINPLSDYDQSRS